MNESEETEVKTFPQRQRTILWTCATGEASNKPAQSHSPIRIFTGHILDSKECLSYADSRNSDQTARMRRLV